MKRVTDHDQVGFNTKSRVGSTFETQCNSSYKQSKKKNHMINTTVAEKVFDKK